MSSWRNIVSLAYSDYSHEWHMSACFILGLAAVLAPLMVLFGVKFGIITNMMTSLSEDPGKREIRPLGSSRYTAEWFASVRARPEVAFVVPRTRTLAATVELRSRSAPFIVPAELIPSGEGDPLLASSPQKPRGLRQIVLSDAAARKLNVAPGAGIEASLARQYGGQRERVEFKLEVAGIARPAAFSRPAAFTSLELLLAAESFRDGRAVPEFGWAGGPPVGAERSYPAYRLYARSVYEVAGLAQLLSDQGQKVKTNADEIETVLSVDRNLSIVFWIIAIAGMIGFSLSLSASLWANTDRKRRELSVLRLVGFASGGIILFPAFQSLFTAVLGWLGAVLVYLVLEAVINALLGSHLEAGQSVCFLLPLHFAAALAMTLVAALIAALLGGLRAARIEPSDGLRDI